MMSKAAMSASLIATAILAGCGAPRLNPLQQDCLTRATYEQFGNCMKSATLMVAPFTNQNNLDLYKLYSEQIDKYGRDVADGIVEDQAARNYLGTFYLDLVHYANTRTLKSDMVQGAIRLNEHDTEVIRRNNGNRNAYQAPISPPK